MAAWGFTCVNCNKQFAQFRIEDTVENYFIPEKPDVPKGGKEFACPNCGHNVQANRFGLYGPMTGFNSPFADHWNQFSFCSRVRQAGKVGMTA